MAGPRQIQTHNHLSRFLVSTTSINPESRSHQKGFVFFTPKVMPFFKEKIWLVMWYSVAFLSICISQLLRNACSFRLNYSRISRTQHGKVIQEYILKFPAPNA